ncbi:MAG: glycosyltransferase family 2 protein [Alphaproteobacteria bacterium]
MADLTVIILTYNEEKHLARALASVRPVAARIVVVDSHSNDATCRIARDAGADVLQHDFVNQAQQFNWALENAGVTTGWVMRLDADEVVEDDLAREIEARLGALGPEIAGIRLRRKHIFLGRWIRWGGRYPVTLLRLWRNGAARSEQRWMDEHIVLLRGRVVTFRGGFADHNLNDITAFTEKHNRYATREAVEIINQRYGLFPRDEIMTAGNKLSGPALKRYLKENVYNVAPAVLNATLYFIWRYFLLLGFLDGKPGFIYHFLQGYWYRVLVEAKVFELERALAPLSSAEERLAALARHTGLPLDKGG